MGALKRLPYPEGTGPQPKLRFERLPSDERWFLSLEETAHRLSISRREVARMIARGELAERRIGRRRLVCVASLQRWLREGTA